MVKPICKNELRKHFLSLRNNYPLSSANLASNIINNKLLNLLNFYDDNLIISGYFPIRKEVDILPLISQLIGTRDKIALPSIVKDHLKFLMCNDLKTLKCGSYNIPEPTGEELIPNIIIAPLVACDRNFNRLGYGKGFYDKAISSLRSNQQLPIVIGVGYHFQLTEQLPATDLDQMLDIIVTECGTYYRNG